MNQVILTTESSCDLSEETRTKHGILIVPFSVNFPDRTVLDGEIPVQEIYDYYNKTKKIPKTNAVNPNQYTEFFEEIASRYPGCDIVHIGYASACSCSFQNAVIGVKDCTNARVHLIDSENVSGGLGNLVLKADEVLRSKEWDSVEQLIEAITYYVKRTRTSFVPDTLDFLKAGGRVSNAAAIGAAILSLKPRIDIVAGKLIAAKKYRGGMKRIIPTFVDDFMKDRTFDKERAYVFYAEGAEKEVVEELIRCVRDQGFRTVSLDVLGCVMTVHGGKGAVGISATEI